jgi:hypothetical protein
MLAPEKRPFPILAYNQLFRYAKVGTKLDCDRLIKKARRNTKLRSFGRDFSDESLKRLIRSINDEAGLHPFGVLMMREKLISQLENRLWAEHWFNMHPEILEQQVLPIVLVTGLQRTGTTKMQRELSALPGARALRSWEALYPAPLGDKNESNRRIARTRRNEKAISWISPTFQSIHPIHTDQPEEDVLLLDVHFMSSSSEAIMNVPSYAGWLSNQDHTSAYAYEMKLLKLLQWQKGGRYWVLKSPHHLEYLYEISSVFSDVKIIWMHRPIEQSIPSFFSMLYYSRSMFSQAVSKQAIVDQWTSKLTKMLKAGLRFRTEKRDQVTDILFDDFLTDASRVLADIAHRIPHIGQSAGKRIDNINARYVSKHHYGLSDWGLEIDALKKSFAFYQQNISASSTENKAYE